MPWEEMCWKEHLKVTTHVYLHMDKLVGLLTVLELSLKVDKTMSGKYSAEKYWAQTLVSQIFIPSCISFAVF